MKFYCYFAALLLAFMAPAQVVGQSVADSATAPAYTINYDLSKLSYSRLDTLRALRHLFIQRSVATRGWLQAGTNVVLDGATENILLAARRNTAKRRDRAYDKLLSQQANQDMVVGTLMLGYGLFRLSRFGPQQYQRVVAAYTQGQPLPSYLKRRLKTRYFRALPIGSR